MILCVTATLAEGVLRIRYDRNGRKCETRKGGGSEEEKKSRPNVGEEVEACRRTRYEDADKLGITAAELVPAVCFLSSSDKKNK